MSDVEFIAAIKSTIGGILSTELISAFVGAMIGGYFARNATTKAHEYATQKSKNDELIITKNTLKLIKTEINTAWGIYRSEYGDELLNLREGTAFVRTFPIGDNPFPIYDSAPSCLANVDPPTSAKIVRMYMRVKGLITMIKLNNADCEAIYSAGRYATQSLVNKAIEEKQAIDEDGAKRINEYYIFYIEQEAKKLQMDNTANGLKSLTIELELLLSEINNDIDRLTAPSK